MLISVRFNWIVGYKSEQFFSVLKSQVVIHSIKHQTLGDPIELGFDGNKTAALSFFCWVFLIFCRMKSILRAVPDVP